ncbi:hypothetical protein [Rhodoferax sp.]|uniref:hypothetical protein n=1 Tax=Rhodoferax sp. TaxID=50421 RepID=UPI0025D9585C|nr:hypothetical protein [Rhodoferax sp.]
MARFSALVVGISLAALGGCASSPKPASSNTAAATTVPSLKIVLDCGACQVRPTVPSLIQEGYNTAAASAGARVSNASEAVLTIKDYAERSDGARFFAGAFAGKDEIKATVVAGSKQFSIEDYYRNAWQGIESLAKKIGASAFEKLQ